MACTRCWWPSWQEYDETNVATGVKAKLQPLPDSHLFEGSQA